MVVIDKDNKIDKRYIYRISKNRLGEKNIKNLIEFKIAKELSILTFNCRLAYN